MRFRPVLILRPQYPSGETESSLVLSMNLLDTNSDVIGVLWLGPGVLLV